VFYVFVLITESLKLNNLNEIKINTFLKKALKFLVVNIFNIILPIELVEFKNLIHHKSTQF